GGLCPRAGCGPADRGLALWSDLRTTRPHPPESTSRPRVRLSGKPLRRALAEDLRAHPHKSGPLLDRHLEVVAHAHGGVRAEEERLGAGLVPERAQPAEVGAGPLRVLRE